jgi:3-oxoisoapionate decarboxylase
MNAVFPIGISSYALRWSIQWQGWSPERVLQKAAEVGAQVVQICDNLAPEARPEHELRDLAALAADLGLAIELGATGCSPEHLRACLRAASLLNAPILRMVIAADSSGSPAELENTIRNSLPELCERGVCLAIENHFDLSPRDLKQLVETIASPSVGICLDVFNSIYHLSSQAETLAWLAPYAISVHVKDVDLRRLNTGFYVYGCRLGTGRLDFEGLLSALQRNGSTPALLLESWMDRLESKVETCAQEESWLRDGIQFLKQNTMMEVP